MFLAGIFSHSIGCCFVQMMVSFALQKHLSLMRSHLLIVDFSAFVIGVLFRKSFPEPVILKLFLTFSSIVFSIEFFDSFGVQF